MVLILGCSMAASGNTRQSRCLENTVLVLEWSFPSLTTFLPYPITGALIQKFHLILFKIVTILKHRYTSCFSVNRKINPKAHNIAGDHLMFSPCNVTNQLNTFTPVGIAMIFVADLKYARVSTS